MHVCRVAFHLRHTVVNLHTIHLDSNDVTAYARVDHV